MKEYYALRHKESGEYLTNEGNAPIMATNEKYFEDFMANTDWWKQSGFYKKSEDKYILADPSEMMIIEWVPRAPFLYAIDIDCSFEFGGHGVVSTIEIPQIKMTEDEQGYPTPLKDENQEYVYERVRKLLLSLHSGYVNFGWSTAHDEGYSNEFYAVEEGEDSLGQPVWLIECQTGGCDCDGPLERYNYLKSKGGKTNIESYVERMMPKDKPLTEEETELYRSEYRNEYAIQEYRSPMTYSKHQKAYQRDHYAEAMGY